MTRYDPFAYGQVPFGQKEQAAAPDDMLFRDTAPGKQSPAPASDSDWSLPADHGSNAFQPGKETLQDALAFGTDILGESLPATASPGGRPGAASARPQPAAAPRPAVAGRPAMLQSSGSGRSPDAPPAGRATIRPGVVPVLMPRQASTASVVVPIAIVGLGGGVAAWLHLMQQNPIMAAILGVTSLVGAALAFVMLRR